MFEGFKGNGGAILHGLHVSGCQDADDGQRVRLASSSSVLCSVPLPYFGSDAGSERVTNKLAIN